jgi:COP9 signalosome complex subunit 7
LDYNNLQQALDMNSLRDLEDLIIDGIYSHVFRAKLNQAQACLEVEFALGRDVSMEQLDSLWDTLSTW